MGRRVPHHRYLTKEEKEQLDDLHHCPEGCTTLCLDEHHRILMGILRMLLKKEN